MCDRLSLLCRSAVLPRPEEEEEKEILSVRAKGSGDSSFGVKPLARGTLTTGKATLDVFGQLGRMNCRQATDRGRSGQRGKCGGKRDRGFETLPVSVPGTHRGRRRVASSLRRLAWSF